MGKPKTTERLQAQDLYVNTTLTLKQIADMVKVSAVQIGKWSNADEWEGMRHAARNTSGKIILGWYAQLQQLQDEITKQGGVPTKSQSSTQREVVNNIQALNKRQNLSMYHTVLKEFLKDLLTINADAAKQFGPLLLDFMKRKATQLNNDL